MSDRSTSPPPSHGVLLDAFRAQQRTLEDNWTSWLKAWQGGWRTPDTRSPAGTATEREGGGARRGRDAASGDTPGRAARATSLEAAEWYVRAAQDTLEMINTLSRTLSGDTLARGEAAAALWRRLAENASGGSAFGTDAGGAAAIGPEALVRAFTAPWAVAGSDGAALLERWLGIPLSTSPPGADSDGRSGGNAWDELSRLVGGASRQVSLGPIEPELARRSAELSETALACLGALQRYQALHLGALARIAGLFLDTLSGSDDDRDPPDSLRGLFERWIECGDRVLLDMYRSDDYLAVQRELLESLMRYRVQWQALQDLVARLAGRPTREELDDVHRVTHELRRELRAQRREHRELKATISALADARTAAAPRRRGADGSAARGKRGNVIKDDAKRTGARKSATARSATATAKKTD